MFAGPLDPMMGQQCSCEIQLQFTHYNWISILFSLSLSRYVPRYLQGVYTQPLHPVPQRPLVATDQPDLSSWDMWDNFQRGVKNVKTVLFKYGESCPEQVISRIYFFFLITSLS